jgi:hypothetical protein
MEALTRQRLCWVKAPHKVVAQRWGQQDRLEGLCGDHRNIEGILCQERCRLVCRDQNSERSSSGSIQIQRSVSSFFLVCVDVYQPAKFNNNYTSLLVFQKVST